MVEQGLVELTGGPTELSCAVAVDEAPWDLPIDALVVSVGPAGFGDLGNTLLERHPEADWESVDLQAIVPDKPVLLPVEGKRGLRTVVLATVRPLPLGRMGGIEAPVTEDTIRRAVVAALTAAAARAGARTVGLPLLSGGAAGRSAPEAADVVVPEVLAHSRKLALAGLGRVVFVCPDISTSTTIRSAYGRATGGPAPDLVEGMPGGKPAPEGEVVAPTVEPTRPARRRTRKSTPTAAKAAVAEAPESEVPESAEAPESAEVPESGVPESEAPESEAPESEAPESEAPAAEAPESGVPESEAPESAVAPRPVVGTPVLGETGRQVLSAAAALEETALLGDSVFAAGLERGGSLGRRLSRVLTDRHPDGAAGAARLRRFLSALAGSPAELTEDQLLGDPWIAAVVERAADVARGVGHSQLDVEHLLASVLLGGPSAELLEAVGASAYDLRVRLRDVVLTERPEDDPAAWDEALGTGDLAGGISKELVDPSEGLPLSADHLGVAPYVTMLATVIARKDTPLPLSVGLFGEWGSGKSYFMGLLRGQVSLLAKSDDDTYYRDVVQIGFNAWHYADTNLWASLGNTIFGALAGPAENDEQRRTRVQEELREKSRRRQELNEATANAEAEAARLRREIEEARYTTRNRLRTLIEAAAGSPAVKARLATVWRRLGVDDPVDQGELLSAEVRGARADLGDWRRVATRRRPVAFAVVALALVLLAGGIVAGGSVGRWLAGGGLTTVAAAAGLVAAGIARARAGLSELAAVAAEIRTGADKKATAAVQPQLESLRQAEATEDVLRAQLDDVVIRVGELGRELASLTPGERLYSFVSERAASEDYRGRLGLVSTVRHDFQQLADLMKRWEGERAKGQDAPRPIDRIVLYIDDLDRCSPRQVVDVLQAVHLLLALDLFVVVLGVDPRVLHQSLLTEMSGTFGDGEGAATPFDYLEKIFNIPFVLPVFGPDGFAALLEQVSAAQPPAVDHPAATEAPGGTAQAPAAATGSGDGAPSGVAGGSGGQARGADVQANGSGGQADGGGVQTGG
ncbi:MAG TPA: P-loop NTPase fold protein, partial [Mycobacteriales bacterium]